MTCIDYGCGIYSIFRAFGLLESTHLIFPVGVYLPHTVSAYCGAFLAGTLVIAFACFISLAS